MMKKVLLTGSLVVSLAFNANAGGGNSATLDDIYDVVNSNNKKLSTLDSKANVSQASLDRIESVSRVTLARFENVFKITVNENGSLWLAAKKYAKEVGISQQEAMMVLVGSNGITDLSKINKGDLIAPKPGTEAFRTALKKGEPRYRSWLEKQSVNVKVASVEMKRLDVTEEAHFKKVVKDQEVIHDLVVDKELHKDATYEKLHIAELQIDELKGELAKERSKSPVVVTKTVVKYADMTAPAGMQLNVPGTGCDHIAYGPGAVSTSVLEFTKGKGGDSIEIVGPMGPDNMRMAKRLHTDKRGHTRAYQWIQTGECVALYQKAPFKTWSLNQLLVDGETIVISTVSELDQEEPGSVLTESLYNIKKK